MSKSSRVVVLRTVRNFNMHKKLENMRIHGLHAPSPHADARKTHDRDSAPISRNDARDESNPSRDLPRGLSQRTGRTSPSIPPKPTTCTSRSRPVANEASNILQDVKHSPPLRVVDLCKEGAFELLGTCSEVVGLGCREPINLMQARNAWRVVRSRRRR
jgi:hypothetical protein